MTEKEMKDFFSNFEVRGSNECWEWKGWTPKYGAFPFRGCVVRASRLAYRLFVGEIGGLHVLHDCDNPPCVNPRHLFLGTHKDNMQDMVKKGRHRTKFLDGENHVHAKLAEKQVVEMREMSKAGVSIPKLARLFRVHIWTVHGIITGKSWKKAGGPVCKGSKNFAKGADNANTKLNKEKVESIRRKYAEGGTSLRKLAREYNVGSSTIKGVIDRRWWV